MAFIESKFNKTYQKHINRPKVVIMKITLVCIPVVLLLTIEMGFRGDFTQDIINYFNQFNITYNWADVTSSSKNQGYNAMMVIFHQFSHCYLYFLVFLALIMSSSLVLFFWNEAHKIWLALFVMFCCGVFYSGFNIMREFLAFSLFTLCIRFIYRKQFKYYVISILIISTVHLSAVFMLPLYFIPRIRWKSFDRMTIILSFILIVAFVFLFMGRILDIVTTYIYEEYNEVNAFGMNKGTSMEGTLKAIALSLIVVINLKYFNRNNDRDMLVYNGCLLYMFFAICGFRVYMLQRLTMYFSAFLMIAYPLIISRIRSQSIRRNAILFLSILLISSIANLLLSTTYYFYWDNQTVDWAP